MISKTAKIQLFNFFIFLKIDVKMPSVRCKNLTEGLLLCFLQNRKYTGSGTSHLVGREVCGGVVPRKEFAEFCL